MELSEKRAIAYFRYQNIPAEMTYTQFEDKPRFEEIEELADRYIAPYTSGAIDQVQVCYMKFQSMATQVPAVTQLLPLEPVSSETAKDKPAAKIEYEYVPDPKNILEEILPVAFKVRLFKTFLDAAVSEQIALRVAMKAATENAGDMIKLLTRQYNLARQAQITKEIAEVIGGVEALK